MAITSVVAERLDEGVVRVVAVSDVEGASFYWELDGEYLGSSVVGWRDFLLEDFESALVGVFDDLGDVGQGVGFPRRVTIVWRHVEGAVGYRIDRVSPGEDPVSVYVEGGKGAYAWRSPRLVDGVHEFEILPLGAGGLAEGESRHLEVLVVGLPDAPELTVEHGEGVIGGTVT